MNTKIWAAAVLMALLAGGAARANDGGIAYGGSPRLLSGHPSVSMQSEVITMRVGEANVTTDCRFVFRNSGKACTVRMGFPDQGDGAFDPDESNEEQLGDDAAVMKTPPRTTFDSFVSYVNGKRVTTKLIRANKPGQYWHTKTVTFPAHSVTRIRDVYSQHIPSQSDERGDHKRAAYVLHTGSSWRGPIGRSTVNVIFRRKCMPGTLIARRTKIVDDVETVNWKKARFRDVYYIGPAIPTVSGRTLCFTRTKWRPETKDDILLYFREDPKEDAKEYHKRYSKLGKK